MGVVEDTTYPLLMIYKPLINLDGCHSTRRLCRSNMNDYMFYKYVDMDQSYCTAEGSDRRAAQMLAES